MKKLVAIIAFVGSITSTMAAEITWTLQNNTTSDSDVRTEGRCLYAYTPSSDEVNVNGVQFGRYTEETSQFADDASLDVAMSRHSVWMSGREDEWKEKGGGDEYLKLLKYGWYKGSPFPTKLTLTGLTAGKRYLVQIWICDARDEQGGKIRKLTLGDKTGDCYGNGFGSNFVGTFTADGETQTIALGFAGEAHFNAFQVRCLDDARIVWTGSWMSGESDVRTDGGLLYAYKAGSDLTIAGTPFMGLAVAGASALGTDITFNKPFPNRHLDFCTEDASVPDGAYSYSENYRKLIDGELWSEYRSNNGKFVRRNVTLHNLKPGYRYLVQHWVIDNRNTVYAPGRVVVDWGTVLAYNDGRVGGHGSVAVGTFTAVSTEQTFECYYRVSGDDMSGSSSAHEECFGPIQVRCLDDEKAFEGWMVGNTAADGSVDLRGQPLYAFSGVQTTVSGTPFACFGGASDGTPSPGNYGDLVIRKLDGTVLDQTWHHGNAYISQSTVQVSPSVTNLLGNGIYRNGTPDTQLVELRNLQPGRRYLVQAWFTDTRRDMSGKFGGRSLQYRILTNNEAPLGQYVTGVFRATNDTYSVLFEMASPQLNAIQVRALDTPIDGVIRWANEPTKAGSASVSTEGTLKYAYAPYAFTTDSGVAFAEGAAGATVLGGGNVVLEYAFENRNKVFAPDETSDLFKNAWYNLPAGNAANTVTLGNLKPTYEYLVQVFVADLRNSAVGLRTLAIQGNTGRFGPYNGDGVCPYGSVFTGWFTADATTKSFVLNYKSAAEAQLNAVQVRELGPTLAVRVPNSSAAWTTDGAGWTVGGVEQTGKTLWDAANGAANSAYVDGNAAIALGSDVTVASLYGSGELTLGADDTAYALDVKDDISAPLATVKAVWKNPCVRKMSPGTTVLAGACPMLKIVSVYDGCVVLGGAVSRPLDLTVVSPGILGFAENFMLPLSSISSFVGDGALAGPGGILLDDGRAFAVPASLTCVDGFTWGLANGSTLALPANYDASQLCIRIDDPDACFEQLVVTGDETVTGRPKFVYGKKGYRAVREAAGWRIVGGGMMLIFR